MDIVLCEGIEAFPLPYSATFLPIVSDIHLFPGLGRRESMNSHSLYSFRRTEGHIKATDLLVIERNVVNWSSVPLCTEPEAGAKYLDSRRS